MEAPINYETSYKWSLSLGTFLLILSLSIPFFRDLNTNSTIIVVILTVVAILLINSSLTEMKKIEDSIRKYRQELTISEIIKQDLLLMDKELKEIEYNNQIDKMNKNRKKDKLNTKTFRTIKDIIKQALDVEFYEKTYKKYNTFGRIKNDE